VRQCLYFPNKTPAATVAISFVEPAPKHLALRPLVEIAYFIQENGYSKDAASVTLGLEFQQVDWITSAVAPADDRFGTSGPADYTLTASLGRIFKTQATGEFSGRCCL
jgi:hypothetical protein